MMGRDAVYDRLPFFYSDQYDLGLEYTGYAEPDDYDQVVFRGDVNAREFIAFWLFKDRVLAGMNIITCNVAAAITTLIESGRTVNVDKLRGPDTPLEDL